MQLSDLLSQRSQLEVGEVSQIGIGLARALSARHCQGRVVGTLAISDVEILSNQEATLRDGRGGSESRSPRSDAGLTLEERLGDVRDLTRLLLQVARRGGLVGTKNYPVLHAFLLEVGKSPMMCGDFAIALAHNFPLQPIRWEDGCIERVKRAVFGAGEFRFLDSGRESRGHWAAEVSTRAAVHRGSTNQNVHGIRPTNQSPRWLWLYPVLGIVALASWGLVLGVWIGV